MIREILTVSGKPGLFKLVAMGNRALIVETLDDAKKRMPVQGSDKVVSLGDISIFTDEGEMPLSQVFTIFAEKNEGKPLEIDMKSSNEKLLAFFGEFVPDFDRDRVYASHVKKMVSWYNILVAAGITEFEEKVAESEETEKSED